MAADSERFSEGRSHVPYAQHPISELRMKRDAAVGGGRIRLRERGAVEPTIQTGPSTPPHLLP